MKLLREIQIRMTTRGIKPEEFKDQIIFKSMYIDIDWSEGEEISTKTDFRRDIGLFSVLVMKKEWYGTHIYKLEGKWNHSADVMMLNFVESGHPVFRPTSASDRGFLRKKGGQLSIHFNGESANAELLFRTINSVNRLSVCGAVAD